MDPARYRQIKSVLMEALDRPPDERKRWVQQRCGDDLDLRREVDELLAGEAQQSFLEHSPLPLTGVSGSDIDVSGSRLGRIRLDRLLARGGMGEVYAGTDELLQRPVAVKLMKAELRMSAARRSAFLAEARVLSGLRHPNICEVHDFFEDAAQDVLVLELIEGQTLRSLLQAGRPTDPLRIALQIADALVAAHERGIAHRDLKPENVMVTTGGQVKVLDFGLARMDATLPGLSAQTEPGETPRTQIAGTPGYLSPEQARGEASTTATDLWSFGLLLGELLSGRLPYPSELSSQELLQRASLGQAEVPAGLPRAETLLIRRLLAPAPQQRPSAREARELLTQIIDRPARRWRWGMAAGIVGMALVSGWKYTVDLRAERETALAAQARAEAARTEAEDLANFMLIDLYSGLRAVGRLGLLEPVALKAVEYYGDLGETRMRSGRGERAMALIRVGEVLDMQGHLAEATDAYHRAVQALQPMAAQRPDDELVQYRLALATRNYGEVLRFGGDYANSDPHARRAIELARQLVAGFEPGTGPEQSPNAEERWSLLLRGLYLYADSMFRQGKAGEAIGLLDEAEAMAVPGVVLQPGLLRDLADIRYKRCMAYFDSQRADRVVEACQASFEMDQAVWRDDPEDIKLMTNLASAFWMLGRAQHLEGRLDQAIDTTDQGLAMADLILRAEPDEANSKNMRAVLLVSRGRILRDMGLTAEATGVFTDVLNITQPLLGNGSDHATMHNHMIALTFLGRIDEARPFARKIYDSGWRRPEFLQMLAEYELLPEVTL